MRRLTDRLLFPDLHPVRQVKVVEDLAQFGRETTSEIAGDRDGEFDPEFEVDARPEFRQHFRPRPIPRLKGTEPARQVVFV